MGISTSGIGTRLSMAERTTIVDLGRRSGHVMNVCHLQGQNKKNRIDGLGRAGADETVA